MAHFWIYPLKMRMFHSELLNYQRVPHIFRKQSLDSLPTLVPQTNLYSCSIKMLKKKTVPPGSWRIGAPSLPHPWFIWNTRQKLWLKKWLIRTSLEVYNGECNYCFRRWEKSISLGIFRHVSFLAKSTRLWTPTYPSKINQTHWKFLKRHWTQPDQKTLFTTSRTS